MHILSISHFSPAPYLPPSGYGGAAFEKPTAIINRSNFHVTVVAPVPLAPFPLSYFREQWRIYANVALREIIENVEVYHPRFFSLPNSILQKYSGYFMYRGIKKLVYRLHKKHQFRIIHAHNTYPDGYAAMMLCQRLEIPLVVAVRGTDIDITYNNKDCSRKLKSVLDFASFVICPAPRIKIQLDTIINNSKSQVICNGIDIDELSNIDAKILNAHDVENKIIILSVCILIDSKGIDLNILAIKELLKKNDNLIYVIVGDGPARPDLEKLVCAFNLQNHVYFVGTVDHKEALSYISACDIFALPSWQETFGLVYLEALALGKPIIGCTGQGMDKIISDNNVGLLSAPKDWQSVKDALQYLIENRDTARNMGARGKELVHNQFAHNINAEKTMALYNIIANRVSRPVLAK